MLKRNWSLTGVSLAAIIFYAVCGLLLLLRVVVLHPLLEQRRLVDRDLVVDQEHRVRAHQRAPQLLPVLGRPVRLGPAFAHERVHEHVCVAVCGEWRGESDGEQTGGRGCWAR